MKLTPMSEAEIGIFSKLIEEEAENLSFSLQILSGYSDAELSTMSPSDWLPERLRQHPNMLCSQFALALVRGFINGRRDAFAGQVRV